jgi:hypothetical protein
MPLTSKGEKLRDKFRGQYGKKKGDSVFYAMENSGKLKGILKAKGGADASKDDFKTPSSSAFSAGYSGAKSAIQTGRVSSNGGNVSGGGKKTKLPFSKDQIITGALNLAAFPLGYAVKMFRNREQKKPNPLSANTKKQTILKPPTNMGGGDNNNSILCPDGTPPPCKPKTVEPTKANKPNFLSEFQSYNSGGVSSGPPPKRGPNPQVPPIKMRNGKMTKTYKMSCPHRPDGIRGMGAAIKGHKFIGVK